MWQFYQLIVKQVSPQLSLLLFAPSLLLEEIYNGKGEYIAGIPFEAFRSSVETTTAYKLLEDQVYGQIGSIRIPFYRKLADKIKKSFYDGNVVEHAINKLLQREGIGVVHVPVQYIQLPGTVKRVPYLINPHDYQHEYFPEFFTSKTLEFRRNIWYRDQRDAAAVVVHSQQTRSDAVKFLGIPEERIFYAPYGPLDTFPEPDETILQNVIREFSLPERFVFYPARMWRHKNHLALVEAVRYLKKRDLDVNVVFTIADGKYGEEVKQRIITLGLQKQVIIVGRVSPQQMGALYRLSTMVVAPSLFEQNSGPVLEAIHYGKAVAASDIEEVIITLEGAGVIFDPHSVQEIADAIDLFWSSEEALREAETKIQQRYARMSWKPFQEVYQQAYDYASQVGVMKRSSTTRHINSRN